VEIYKEFKFEAAHKLVGVPPTHKCARLHGHSYRVRVYLRGPLDPTIGWVMDFADLKAVCKPVIDELDHSYLNEIDGLHQSTAECIAVWLWRRLKPQLPLLCRVEVRETATSGAMYEGDAT
jgi:6-pyruvoyltetrahydropterin/6-carboxytetrahydropterin synthase